MNIFTVPLTKPETRYVRNVILLVAMALILALIKILSILVWGENIGPVPMLVTDIFAVVTAAFGAFLTVNGAWGAARWAAGRNWPGKD